MNKNRLIFYGVFFLFHLSLLFVSIFFNSKEQDELINYFMKNFNKLLTWISLSKYVSILGLILVITDIIWSFMTNKKHQEEKTSLINELTTLKAKLFDLQEDAKKAIPPPSPKEIK